jgi:hypothetical protein
MLSFVDILGGGLCLLLLLIILRAKLRKYDELTRSFFQRAFLFRIFCAIAFSLITAYYYKGGDTEMFLYATRDIHAALQDGTISLADLFFMENALDDDPLFYYFDIDDSKYPVSGFMRDSGNFMVPKLGLLPYVVFFKSYLAMCLIFSFFAFAGCMRLFKLFKYYFPKMNAEIALAVLFIPSACYWSSGFLKDSICFGAVGFLLYGLHQIFIARKAVAVSIFWVVLSAYLLYTIKVYILLALIPGAGLWIFGAITSRIRTKSLRRVSLFFALLIAGFAAVYLVNYLTSDASLAKFSMENILETSDYSRRILERHGDSGSNFQINTSNPVLLMLNGLVATFFRPFPWEISSAIVAFSALEAVVFLALFIYLLFVTGIGRVTSVIFSSPLLLLCFSFAVVFAISVGISTTNFGSLSRYKIPCLPFYLMFILGTYHITNTPYPGWMKKILNFLVPNRLQNVRHRRLHQYSA